MRRAVSRCIRHRRWLSQQPDPRFRRWLLRTGHPASRPGLARTWVSLRSPHWLSRRPSVQAARWSLSGSRSLSDRRAGRSSHRCESTGPDDSQRPEKHRAHWLPNTPPPLDPSTPCLLTGPLRPHDVLDSRSLACFNRLGEPAPELRWRPQARSATPRIERSAATGAPVRPFRSRRRRAQPSPLAAECG